jgi:hypothetical protein
MTTENACGCPIGAAEEADLLEEEDGFAQFKVYVYGDQSVRGGTGGHIRRLDRNFDTEKDARRYGYKLMQAHPGVLTFHVVDMQNPRQAAVWYGRRTDFEKHSVEQLIAMPRTPPRSAVGERLEAIAEPVVAQETQLQEDSKPSTCMPWLRIEKDPTKFKACMDLSRKLGRIESSKQLYEVVRQQMEREDQEVYYVIALDTQLFLRGVAELGRGARDSVQTSIQDTARYAIAFAQLYGAQALAVAHNHPSGASTPSSADNSVTQAVLKMCEANDILFLDHIVVGSDNYYSFKDNGKV